MKKFVVGFLMPAMLAGAAYKYRYKLLNTVLANPWMRKVSINTAMKLPGVRSRLLSSAFRK